MPLATCTSTPHLQWTPRVGPDSDHGDGSPKHSPSGARGTRSAADLQAAGKLKVVVCDDVPVNRVLLFEYLKLRGVTNILHCSNGQECVELTAQHPDADVVFMDLHMPVMDGHTAARVIRARPQKPVVVAVSADASDGVLARCRGSGMNLYVGKPFRAEVIARVIDRVLAQDVRKP